MTAFYLDRQERRLKLVLAVLLLILLLLQVRLWSGAGSLADIDRLGREIEVQQSDNALLQERNEALRKEVSDLKNGMDSIEERARSKLGLVRKGETFILIVDGEQAANPAAAAPGVNAPLPEQFEDESVVETLPPPPEEAAAIDPATVAPLP